MKTRDKNNKPQYTERIIQFGGGVFLRGFFDYIIDEINEKTDLDAGIVIVKSTNSEQISCINQQDGLYHLWVRGLNQNKEEVEEKRLISSVNREVSAYKQYQDFLNLAHQSEMRFIISNTTEAGISYDDKDEYDARPAHSYPAKLTRFLHERFLAFSGASDKGFILFPCELIEDNGNKLYQLVCRYAEKWALEESFKLWLKESNTWCNTLVDRIVTAPSPEEKKEFDDAFLVCTEPYYSLIIDGPQEQLEKELKLLEVSLKIRISDQIDLYRECKVGLLNGAHTALASIAYLQGFDFVRESLKNPLTKKYLDFLFNKEIIPSLRLAKKELVEFAEQVITRFENPSLNHQWLAISLNSMSKYKTRLLPQVLVYIQKNSSLPSFSLFALASLIVFYRGERQGEKFILKDDAIWLKFFRKSWLSLDKGEMSYEQLVEGVLTQKDHWGQDLNEIAGLKEKVVLYLEKIEFQGITQALQELINEA